MTEQKRKLSKLCLTGFILSVLSPILLAINTYINWKFYDWDLYYDLSAYVIVVAAALPIVGLILSIIGVITAAVKHKKGKGFGIAGIVLPNLYAAFIVALAVLFGSLMIWGTSKSKKAEAQSDLTSMGSAGYPVNTEYDVSGYRFCREDETIPPGLTVSDTEHMTYSRSKLDTITKTTDKIISGRYMNYNFIIVKRDLFEMWIRKDPLGSMYYNTDGYAVISYSITWEFSAARIYTLDVYKDPSEKFVIVTDCDDYKIINEFFG